MSQLRASGRLWASVIIAIIAAVLVTVLGIVITHTSALTAAELPYLESLDLQRTPAANALALMINDGFGPWGAAAFGAVAAVLTALVVGSWWAGVRFAILIAVPWLAVTLIKLIVERPRPDMSAMINVIVPQPSSTSFPSGHTAFATALGCAAVVTVLRYVRSRALIILTIVGAVALALVTAWSRMYLGVHQPSDVAASMLFVPLVSWATAEVTARWEQRRAQISA